MLPTLDAGPMHVIIGRMCIQSAWSTVEAHRLLLRTQALRNTGGPTDCSGSDPAQWRWQRAVIASYVEQERSEQLIRRNVLAHEGGVS